MVPEVGIAPTSPPLQGGANLPQLLGVVVPRGNAPRSSGYQPGALLLSYRTEIGSSGAPWQRRSRVCFGLSMEAPLRIASGSGSWDTNKQVLLPLDRAAPRCGACPYRDEAARFAE